MYIRSRASCEKKLCTRPICNVMWVYKTLAVVQENYETTPENLKSTTRDPLALIEDNISLFVL
jgi:hypothetical protein